MQECVWCQSHAGFIVEGRLWSARSQEVTAFPPVGPHFTVGRWRGGGDGGIGGRLGT